MREDELPPFQYYDIMGMPEETLIEMLRNMHKRIDEEIASEKGLANSKDDMLNKGYEIVEKNNRNYLVKKKESAGKTQKEETKLLTDEDMGIKPKVCEESKAITNLILKRYPQYFIHKIPKEGIEPTKTYIQICNKITDVYNGTFVKSRFYPLGEKFLKNKQFDVTGYKEKLKEVKDDWLKVKKLILTAVKNFDLMHEENRMTY